MKYLLLILLLVGCTEERPRVKDRPLMEVYGDLPECSDEIIKSVGINYERFKGDDGAFLYISKQTGKETCLKRP